MELTPVEDMFGFWAKREDLACRIGPERPSGAKVRQYMAMAAKNPPGTPMVVGCSAFSAQQLYVADAAARVGAPGFIFVPARAAMTPATKWCIAMGATIEEVRPGYPSIYRARAKAKAKALGGCIRWDVDLAVTDTAAQTENLPRDCQRVVVPTGSGLTAAGVLAGLAERGRFDVEVVCVAVSDMADPAKILQTANGFTTHLLPRMVFVRHGGKYETPTAASLPNGVRLDPFYAAKALVHVQPGDVLWVSGARPETL